MYQVINLTPHPINIRTKAGDITIASSGIARCKEIESTVGAIDGIPVIEITYGEVTGLPDADPPLDGYSQKCPECCSYEWFQWGCEGCGQKPRVYVVSAIVARACAGRHDVFVPARTIRDAEGRIVACTALARVV